MHFSAISYVNTANTNKTSKYLTRNKCMFSVSTCCPTRQTSSLQSWQARQINFEDQMQPISHQTRTLTYNNELCFFNQLHQHESSVTHLQVRVSSQLYLHGYTLLSIVDSTLSGRFKPISKYQNKFAPTLCELTDSLSFT